MALAYLPTALSVALRPLFPFRQAQYGQVILLKPVPFCKLFAGLGSNNKSGTSLLLLSDSCSVLTTLPLLCLSFYLNLSGRSGRNCLLSLSCSIKLQWVPGHLSLTGNDVANELAKWGALLVPSAIPCSLSPLICHMHSCLFLDQRHTASSKFTDTKVPSIYH